MSLVIRKAVREGQSTGDILKPFQIADVRGRADDGHVLPPALGRRADIHQLHAIGFRRQLLPIGFELGVIGDLVILAEVEPEGFFGSGDLNRTRLRGGSESAEGEDADKPGAAADGHSVDCTEKPPS